jgi:hypothetical protein
MMYPPGRAPGGCRPYHSYGIFSFKGAEENAARAQIWITLVTAMIVKHMF